MKRTFSYLILALLCIGPLSAQEIEVSHSSFVEYHKGTLPIVISVPNGGSIDPDSIPNRDCNNPSFNSHGKAIAAALSISNNLYGMTGCFPHIVINNLHRKKVECNRKKILGTCYEPIAEKVWDEYHGYLTQAIDQSKLDNRGNVFLFDLSEHDHAFQRIELGYLILGIDLQSTDPTIDLDDPINQTSIEHLVDHNSAHQHRSQLLRGSLSLGALLLDENIEAVPSDVIPYPFNVSEYITNTYITEYYSDPQLQNNVVAISMSLNDEGVTDTDENISNFGLAFASSITKYIGFHRQLDLVGCGSLEDMEDINSDTELGALVLFPNPTHAGRTKINLEGVNVEGKGFTIHDRLGRLIHNGIIHNHEAVLPEGLLAGIYFITTWESEVKIQHQRKFILVDP